MNTALVRWSTVVALTVPLVAAPALALAAPQPVTAVRAAGIVDPRTGSAPAPEDPAPVPTHDMDHMEMGHTEGTHDMDEMDGMEGMDHGTPPPAERPLVPVLSAFGGLNAAVLVSAAVLRRHDRNHPRHRPRAAATPTAAESRRASR